MTKQIYNEGRVVGISSYEEYVRQLKSVDPEFDVCTEREWLAASLGMGSSLVLRIPKGCGTRIGDSDMYMYQVETPEGCHVAAGNTIVASYFYGECEDLDENGWGKFVTDYGSLISNTEESHPLEDSTEVTTDTVPVKDIVSELELPDTSNIKELEGEGYKTQHIRLTEYVKIVDGIVIQPGTWQRVEVDKPYMDFHPDLNKKPVLRLTFMEEVTNDFYILLTGFTNRSVLRGISKFDLGSVGTDNPQDGDFLGCEAYPWASKIQFVSSPAVDYMFRSSLTSGSRNLKVETYTDRPLIKVTSNNLLSTAVYSRQNAKGTVTNQKTNQFGDPITTWVGNKDAENWYWKTTPTEVTSSKKDKVTVSECSDSSITVSGDEQVRITRDPNNAYTDSVPLGFSVENRYEDDDRTVVENGDHGGFYNIEIDPYQLIKDFIDEVYSRFDYIDARLDEIEGELEKETNRRVNGDKYVFNKITELIKSDQGLGTLVDILNNLLSIIYNNPTLSIVAGEYEDVTFEDDYDNPSGEPSKVISIPKYKWKDNRTPSTDQGTIPRAKLNIYSGDVSGAHATSYMRSRTDNSENDIWSK